MSQYLFRKCARVDRRFARNVSALLPAGERRVSGARFRGTRWRARAATVRPGR